jgi:hypothetical protein
MTPKCVKKYPGRSSQSCVACKNCGRQWAWGLWVVNHPKLLWRVAVGFIQVAGFWWSWATIERTPFWYHSDQIRDISWHHHLLRSAGSGERFDDMAVSFRQQRLIMDLCFSKQIQAAVKAAKQTAEAPNPTLPSRAAHVVGPGSLLPCVKSSLNPGWIHWICAIFS